MTTKNPTTVLPTVIITLLLGILSACNNIPQKKIDIQLTEPNIKRADSVAWTKITDSAQWTKTYNYQMFNFRDTLRIFHPDGCWYSTDGSKWTKSTLNDIVGNQAFLDYVIFNNAIYGLGKFDGNIERYSFKPNIYRTTDMRNWELIAKQSNLPERFFYHPFVFDNKLWIIGGEDKTTQYADIWNSEDAVHWIKQKDNLPFGKRSGSQIMHFEGKLFLLNNDVWSSVDALHWQKVTDEILPFETLFGYSSVVYDNKIFLLGCNRNGQFKSQVFVSSNGIHWSGMEAPWSPRGGIASAVFKDKVFMTGGKYGGLMEDGVTTEFVYSNDLWMMEKK